jgi:hypothetical protein
MLLHSRKWAVLLLVVSAPALASPVNDLPYADHLLIVHLNNGLGGKVDEEISDQRPVAKSYPTMWAYDDSQDATSFAQGEGRTRGTVMPSALVTGQIGAFGTTASIDITAKVVYAMKMVPYVSEVPNIARYSVNGWVGVESIQTQIDPEVQGSANYVAESVISLPTETLFFNNVVATLNSPGEGTHSDDSFVKGSFLSFNVNQLVPVVLTTHIKGTVTNSQIALTAKLDPSFELDEESSKYFELQFSPNLYEDTPSVPEPSSFGLVGLVLGVAVLIKRNLPVIRSWSLAKNN